MAAQQKRILLVILMCTCFFLFHAVLVKTPAFALEAYKKYYLNGLEFKEKGQFEKALEEFSSAIKKQDKEKKKIRFYGMRYGEYLPPQGKRHLPLYAQAVYTSCG